VLQFDEACRYGNAGRIAECSHAIDALRKFEWIAARLNHARATGALRTRLMHHDTKISNVLFDARSGEGLCVCDLDTVMPGTFLSDVGDMMRTYLCEHDENHAETGAISVRADFYDAVEAGYLSEMGGVLTADERALFPLAGSVMIYMQALRFLADYFNNDRYYGARYPAHNRDRAHNQLALLHRYCDLVRDRMPA
jgi:Ser/Thr protein kinase RdoA (MazF antagonist)